MNLPLNRYINIYLNIKNMKKDVINDYAQSDSNIIYSK